MLKKIEKFNIFIVYVKKWRNIIYQEEKGFIRNENNDIEEAKVKSSWKGYSFDVINKLTEEEYLYYSKGKSVTLTLKGEKLAKELIDKYLKQENLYKYKKVQIKNFFVVYNFS